MKIELVKVLGVASGAGEVGDILDVTDARANRWTQKGVARIVGQKVKPVTTDDIPVREKPPDDEPPKRGPGRPPKSKDD